MAGTTYTLSFILLKNPENIDSIIILSLNEEAKRGMICSRTHSRQMTGFRLGFT